MPPIFLLPERRRPDRRKFLKESLPGSVLLGWAAFSSACRQRFASSSGSLKPAGVEALNAREMGTLSRLCQAVLPGPGQSAPARAVPFRIAREISTWSAKNQAQIKSLLALIENGTRYFLFSWRDFSELSLRESQDYLRDWESSRWEFRREAFQALRMMAFFYFYSQDETWKAIGYDGPFLKAASS